MMDVTTPHEAEAQGADRETADRCEIALGGETFIRTDTGWEFLLRASRHPIAFDGTMNTAQEWRRLALALDEIDRLRRWKSEAKVVLDGWDAVWRAAGCPGPLGGMQSDNVVAWIDDLRDLAKGEVR